jgi:hypothetical protein
VEEHFPIVQAFQKAKALFCFELLTNEFRKNKERR